VARGSRAPRSRDVDADFRLLTPRPQRTGRESRCENVGKCEGGNVVVGPIGRFKPERLNRRITDDPPYQACCVQSAPTLVGALPADGFEFPAPRGGAGIIYTDNRQLAQPANF